ncbi:SH3 domain-containing protein [Nostoc sp. TCL26-01]|uniref:SH3 domain-containing protein n=1 Tax=Nostoc sp. TCL26-01 TaxID=2576904 RepID=UPI0015BE2D17|nr:SH3 domain-containing protein [Nostoc sp. TCL26-01]QLE59675.1 SH3 domain-containing protein [Nostoc sp. TCL26-01]
MEDLIKKIISKHPKSTAVGIFVFLFFICSTTIINTPQSSNKYHPEIKSAEIDSDTDSSSTDLTYPEKAEEDSKYQDEPKSDSSHSLNETIPALVKKTGSDFSYETPGNVQLNDKEILVTYVRTEKCNEELPENIWQQEWEAKFDLTSNTWTDKVREISSCLGKSKQDWINFNTHPSRFSIETESSQIIIRADAQDYDNSLIMKDTLVIKYANPKLVTTNEQITHQSSTDNRVVQAGDGYANLRSYPSTEVEVLAKIPNGTSVTILSEETNSAGQVWYKVQVDDKIGWLYSGLVN